MLGVHLTPFIACICNEEFHTHTRERERACVCDCMVGETGEYSRVSLSLLHFVSECQIIHCVHMHTTVQKLT